MLILEKMKTFKSINPFDQSLIAEHEVMSDNQLEGVLKKSELAFINWKRNRSRMKQLI
jgi:hypothetical protein